MNSTRNSNNKCIILKMHYYTLLMCNIKADHSFTVMTVYDENVFNCHENACFKKICPDNKFINIVYITKNVNIRKFVIL